MKFSKQFCAPSSTVSVVPAGLPLRLMYNEHGLLQRISIGFSLDLDPQYEDPDVPEFNYNAFFNRVKLLVPNTINISGGTTWVYGVLYSDNIPCDEGLLPQALYKSYINDVINGGAFEFYAGFVKSLAASYNGPLIIRNFLSMNKFNLLPHIVVPLTMTDDTLQMLMNPGAYPFKYAFIAGFLIFESLHCRYAHSNLLQIHVTTTPDPFVDADGYVKGEVVTESGRTYIFNYSAILHHGVTKGCTLLVEREDEGAALNILSTRMGKGVEKVVENVAQEIQCPVCGKVYRGGNDDAPMQCNDPHCLSHLYFDAVRMMNILGLPSLSYNSYKALVETKTICCLTDLLEVGPCKEQEIVTTLATAMSAVIPTSVVPNFEILERFANKCNHKVETVAYYLENPLRIETDLDLVDPIVRRFATWLADPYNVSTLTTILSRVKIDEKTQKFDGAPIFRGNTFAITGRFKRGPHSEIEAILRSYAADVVPEIARGEKLPSAVLVGSLNEEISGEMIQKARLHHIPILEEDDFFTRYEIDQDLAANLL